MRESSSLPFDTTRHLPNALGEFQLIAALKQIIDEADPTPGVVIGLGDDAAAVKSPSGDVTVLTTDTMVDGVHFKHGEADWKDVGWKSAVSNLSDIAAMGAIPLHALVTIGLPANVSLEEMEQMYRGLSAAFKEFGGGIVGGDVVSSAVFFVTVALTGRTARLENTSILLRRDAAQPGDFVGVTGTLGGSAGGLRAMTESLRGTEADVLKRLHYRPTPRIKEAEILVEAGVTCAMDVSDGLAGDLEKLCTASEVGAIIDPASVPIPQELNAIFSDDAITMALSGGEDYELIFTAPFDVMDRLLARNRGMFRHIGRIVAEVDGKERVKFQNADGSEYHLARKGWDHLDAG